MDDVITAVQGGGRMTTQSLQRNGPGTEMDFSVLAWWNQGFCQRQEADVRRGRLDLQKIGVGVADWHGGGHSCLSRAKTPGAPPTACHPGQATQDGPEVTGAIGGETLLHAPRSAWNGSTTLPHTARFETTRKRQGLAIGGFPLVNQRLERTSGVDGC